MMHAITVYEMRSNFERAAPHKLRRLIRSLQPFMMHDSLSLQHLDILGPQVHAVEDVSRGDAHSIERS